MYISSLIGSKEEEKFLNKKNCYVFRYPIITGKWQDEECEIARICKAIANDEQILLDNPNKLVELLFIDDFINDMFDAIEGKVNRCDFPLQGETSMDPTAPYDGITPVENHNGLYCFSKNTYKTTIGNILKHVNDFNDMHESKTIPEMPPNTLAQKLFAMYLSYCCDIT